MRWILITMVAGLTLGVAGCGGESGDSTADTVDARDDAGDAGGDTDVAADADADPDGAADADADPDVEPDVEPDADPDVDPDAPVETTDGEDVPTDADPETTDGGTTCTLPPGAGCAGMGSFCDVRSCDAGASGTCVTLPPRCPEEWTPVCGCDGETYENDCERIRGGTAFERAGPCGSGSTCGTIAGLACTAPEVCEYDACYPDASGVCVRPPDNCPDVWEPVCGCDGETYANDCERLTMPMGKASDGFCGSGDTCGGSTGITCTDTDEVCDTRSCGDGATGLCIVPPDICSTAFVPVCGCDDTTYLNDCERLTAPTDLDHPGYCDPTECVPACRTGGGGGSRWYDPCTNANFCRADCSACTVTCEDPADGPEGWYADCTGGIEAGCAPIPGLIIPIDCSP